MSESNLWNLVRDGLQGAQRVDPKQRHGHLVRIENGVGAGNPDVDYCIAGTTGDIELKYRRDVPVRPGTPVFTKEGLRDNQILWIYHRCKAGGRVYVLSQIDQYILLHRMTGDLVQAFNKLPLDSLQRQACWERGDGWVALGCELAGLYYPPRV